MTLMFVGGFALGTLSTFGLILVVVLRDARQNAKREELQHEGQPDSGSPDHA